MGDFSGETISLFKSELDTLEESLDFLGQILENLEQSTAVYTICFYEDAEKLKPIRHMMEVSIFAPFQKRIGKIFQRNMKVAKTQFLTNCKRLKIADNV